VTRIEKLYEVSGVNWPAYRGTSMEAVAVEGEVDNPADDEDEPADDESSIDAGLYERASSEFDTFRR